MSYDTVMSLAWEFWQEHVGNPLILVAESKIDLDWSIMGQIGPNKKYNDLLEGYFL